MVVGPSSRARCARRCAAGSVSYSTGTPCSARGGALEPGAREHESGTREAGRSVRREGGPRRGVELRASGGAKLSEADDWGRKRSIRVVNFVESRLHVVFTRVAN